MTLKVTISCCFYYTIFTPVKKSFQDKPYGETVNRVLKNFHYFFVVNVAYAKCSYYKFYVRIRYLTLLSTQVAVCKHPQDIFAARSMLLPL